MPRATYGVYKAIYYDQVQIGFNGKELCWASSHPIQHMQQVPGMASPHKSELLQPLPNVVLRGCKRALLAFTVLSMQACHRPASALHDVLWGRIRK